MGDCFCPETGDTEMPSNQFWQEGYSMTIGMAAHNIGKTELTLFFLKISDVEDNFFISYKL
jgi:hypothetical protein